MDTVNDAPRWGMIKGIPFTQIDNRMRLRSKRILLAERRLIDLIFEIAREAGEEPIDKSAIL